MAWSPWYKWLNNMGIRRRRLLVAAFARRLAHLFDVRELPFIVAAERIAENGGLGIRRLEQDYWSHCGYIYGQDSSPGCGGVHAYSRASCVLRELVRPRLKKSAIWYAGRNVPDALVWEAKYSDGTDDVFADDEKYHLVHYQAEDLVARLAACAGCRWDPAPHPPTPDMTRLAAAVAAGDSAARPLLADACEEAGADPLAEHLRQPDHTLCCYAVDCILGRPR
jgi:hypothetical protein